MRARLLASFIVVSAITIQSQAAMMAYLTIRGQKTGLFHGGITQKGKEGKIGVLAAEHDIISPRDLASGQGTGRKMHRPLKLTLELDKAAPLLYNALTTNETLAEVTVDFWAPQIRAVGGGGMEVNTYSIKLTGASISEIHFNMPNVQGSETAKMPETIEVTFTYQKIEWTWKDGGITAADDWRGN